MNGKHKLAYLIPVLFEILFFILFTLYVKKSCYLWKIVLDLDMEANYV
jgi:hypothetical protein